jgi:DNA topoisomerase VI subunit B
MKQSKIILFVLVFLSSSLFFVSCSKNTVSNQSDIENFSAATKQVLSSKTLLELKQSYSLLSNDEKQILWQTKLDAVLRNNGSKLSVEQKNIINSLKNFVDKKHLKNYQKIQQQGNYL